MLHVVCIILPRVKRDQVQSTLRIPQSNVCITPPFSPSLFHLFLPISVLPFLFPSPPPSSLPSHFPPLLPLSTVFRILRNWSLKTKYSLRQQKTILKMAASPCRRRICIRRRSPLWPVGSLPHCSWPPARASLRKASLVHVYMYSGTSL